MIKVGITGKRDLSNFDIECLKGRIYEELYEIKQKHNECIMLNSIAAGADQLCAEAAISLGYKLICPLPFEEYRYDFSGNELSKYYWLLSQSKQSLIISNSKNTDEAYLAAGKYVVENCDILIAVWDGTPQTSICGTVAIMRYAEEIQRYTIVIKH